MKVAVDVLGSVREPYLQVRDEHVVTMQLRPGSMEVGLRRSEMTRVMYDEGEMELCPRRLEQWVGTADLERLSLSISDAALTATCEGMSGQVELPHKSKLVDVRVGALVAAVNAERTAGFPSGRLFLDSVEQALAAALVDGHAVRRPAARRYRGGLSAARLRRVTELVHAKLEDELSLDEMAESVGLSTPHFAQMFRKSTGESPHQFVLRRRVERAKDMLRAAEARVLDVAVACGFKTQQHFARVFRRLCGTSPTEYRQEVLGFSA
jgi:AraC family transcriptional regulator